MTEPEPSGTALAEALHRAADALPPPALPGDLWTRGRRERRRRVVRRVGAVVAAVVAAALGLPALGVVAPPVVGPAATTVSGYPMRINHQWVVRDLPARPGPLAALVQVSVPDRPTEWRAVSPTGHQWRFRTDTFVDAYPALSADGRYLGYLEPDGVHVRIADLVGGTVTRFSGLSDSASGPGIQRPAEGWYVPGQSPLFFSPDGQRLAFRSGRYVATPGASSPGGFAGPDVVAVLDRRTGRLETVTVPAGRVKILIGWSGPDSVWLVDSPTATSQNNFGAEAVATMTLTDLGLDGAVRSSRTLRPRERRVDGSTSVRKAGLDPQWLSQWTGPVSSDGQRIALMPGGGGTSSNYPYDTAILDLDGTLTNFPSGATSPCPSQWVGRSLAFPMLMEDAKGGAPTLQTQLLAGVRKERDVIFTDQRLISVASPRLDARCVIWAADALAAGPTGWHPFGTSTARWTWYWPELTLTTLLAVLAAAALVIRRRTRRSRIS